MANKTYKYESCLSCEICFYNHENNCTMCKLCDGETNYQMIDQSEIDEIDLALRTEDSKMRYYLDLNPVLSRVNENQERI